MSCVFWNADNGVFSSKNIDTLNLDNNITVCQTNHLSLFGWAPQPLLPLGNASSTTPPARTVVDQSYNPQGLESFELTISV